jgi:hypothetical protein
MLLGLFHPLVEKFRESLPSFRIHLHKWPQVIESPGGAGFRRATGGPRLLSIIPDEAGDGQTIPPELAMTPAHGNPDTASVSSRLVGDLKAIHKSESRQPVE